MIIQAWFARVGIPSEDSVRLRAGTLVPINSSYRRDGVFGKIVRCHCQISTISLRPDVR